MSALNASSSTPSLPPFLSLSLSLSRARARAGSRNLWKNISLFFAIPVVLVTAVNTYVQATKHEAHHHPDASHQPPHMHIRAKVRLRAANDAKQAWDGA